MIMQIISTGYSATINVGVCYIPFRHAKYYKICCVYSSNLKIKSTILVQDQSYSQCSLQAHFVPNVTVKREQKFTVSVFGVAT